MPSTTFFLVIVRYRSFKFGRLIVKGNCFQFSVLVEFDKDFDFSLSIFECGIAEIQVLYSRFIFLERLVQRQIAFFQ